MSTNLHVRDLPDEIHEMLVERAAARRMSLRRYTIKVLAEHCALPTMGEWLDGLERLTPAGRPPNVAEALEQARAEDDAEILGVRSRR